jgi:hypothetical protein
MGSFGGTSKGLSFIRIQIRMEADCVDAKGTALNNAQRATEEQEQLHNQARERAFEVYVIIN